MCIEPDALYIVRVAELYVRLQLSASKHKRQKKAPKKQKLPSQRKEQYFKSQPFTLLSAIVTTDTQKSIIQSIVIKRDISQKERSSSGRKSRKKRTEMKTAVLVKRIGEDKREGGV
ncbi:hypothetical protein NPIL_81491 [Nephila pilipes]|uniref:Uncharacterized protein n=1 Tax=Nephila pilipes TaxID=299642 RepID=A0A8X6N448_NEPPI|nr:hypothetical protein NPIL_81491 [Nephila pilipes]